MDACNAISAKQDSWRAYQNVRARVPPARHTQSTGFDGACTQILEQPQFVPSVIDGFALGGDLEMQVADGGTFDLALAGTCALIPPPSANTSAASL